MKLLTNVCAIVADSFITSPNYPVDFSDPLPSPFSTDAASTYNVEPPYDVHANPITTPTGVAVYILSLANGG